MLCADYRLGMADLTAAAALVGCCLCLLVGQTLAANADPSQKLSQVSSVGVLVNMTAAPCTLVQTTFCSESSILVSSCNTYTSYLIQPLNSD